MNNQTLKEQGWEGFSGRMWERARRDCVPITGTFELTPLCNFSCRMCYVRLDKSEVPKHGRLRTVDEWLSLARQAMDMGTYHITLTGGEVLTRPDFEEIYTGLIEMGLLVIVLSNASLINEDIVRLFQTYRPRKLRFTLYGASNETYERLCGVSNGFDRVMNSLHMLNDAGIPFSLAFTKTTENIGDTDKVIDIAHSLEVSLAVSENVLPAVRGASSEARELRVPLDIPSQVDQLDECEYHGSAFDGGGARHKDVSVFSHCRSYRTSFFVDWNGHMETCSFMSHSGANPFEMGFEAAWKRMHELQARLLVPQECQKCEAVGACPTCAGSREAETGSPTGVPHRLCEEIRAQLRIREKIR